jgi:hypothetical protein
VTSAFFIAQYTHAELEEALGRHVVDKAFGVLVPLITTVDDGDT